MNKRLSQTGWLALAAVGMLPGMTARGQVTQPPYLAKLPDFSHYEIAENPPGKDKRATESKARPHLSHVSITKTGDTRQIAATYSNGKKLEAWMYQGMVLLQQLDPPDVVINTLENAGTDLPVGKEDFQGLDWLGVSTYKQTVSLDGRKCSLFERTTDGAAPDDISRVWVDVATRLPAAMDRQGVNYHFQYGPPPTEALQLPPLFAQAWQKYEGALQTVTVTAPRPPYLASLPDFSRYEMTLVPRGKPDPATDKAAEARMVRAVITKTGATKQILCTLGSGKTIESWMYNGMVMMQQLAPPDIILNAPEYTYTALPVSKSDFKDFDWLSAQSYKRETTYEGAKCYFFEQTTGDDTAKESWRALIDEKTRLPVILERQGLVYRFQYDDAPAEALQLSPAFGGAWQKYQNSLRSVRGRTAPR